MGKSVDIADGLPERTIRRDAVLSGPGGFIKEQLAIGLRGAEPGTGIRLKYRGTKGQLSGAILVDGDPLAHTTSLRLPAGVVHTVEHMLAAISAFGITNLTIEIDDHGHVPFFDGSAAAFSEAILGAGIEEQGSTTSAAVVVREMEITDGLGSVRLFPPQRKSLTVEMRIDFPPPIGAQAFSYEHGAVAFALHLARARTFLSVPWRGDHISGLPGFYFRWAPYPDANMVTHNGARYNLSLRMPDECVRHRTVDAVGDLMVLGMPLLADVVIHRGGHRLMRKAVAALSAALQSERGDLGKAA